MNKKLLVLLSIALFLLFIFPWAQRIILLQYLKDVGSYDTNNTIELFKRAANSSINFIYIYVINITINICDMLGVSFVSLKIVSLIADTMDDDTKRKIKIIFVIISAVGVFGPFIDIYSAGFEMANNFGKALESTANGLLF